MSEVKAPLSAIVEGSGPDLVFIHGLFGSGENLRGTGKHFEDRYRVHYPDLPNHGSSPNTEDATFATMTTMVSEYLETNTVDPILIGHSMGAKVAMLCSLEKPDTVRALGVLDMAPRRYEPSHMDMMLAMQGVPLDEVESRSDADAFLASAIPEAFVRSFLLKSLSRQADGSYRWQLNLSALISDYDDMLGWPGSGTYDGPALFVGGTRSKYLKADRDRDLVLDLFPQAQIHMLEGAGHWIHSERPTEVRGLLASFLAAIPGGR